MIRRLFLSGVLALAFLLQSGRPALAASTWYVNGVTGSDANDCKTPATACKTIGHAIGLASSGDVVQVAAATYPENLTIPISLGIRGAGAPTTIVDGGKRGPVVTIPNAASRVLLAGLTLRNGSASGGNVCFGISGCGGGLFSNGTLTLVASTVSGNSAGLGGGGIFNDSGATATIAGSTLSGNSAAGAGGGGIENLGTLTLRDTIVANSTGGNCGGGVTSNGHNLDSDGACHLTGPGDLSNVDPKLGPLQFNGGPTMTQALLAGSPAIDAGDPAGCKSTNGAVLTRDQRGFPRPDAEDAGVGCDIGAFERQGD